MKKRSLHATISYVLAHTTEVSYRLYLLLAWWFVCVSHHGHLLAHRSRRKSHQEHLVEAPVDSRQTKQDARIRVGCSVILVFWSMREVNQSPAKFDSMVYKCMYDSFNLLLFSAPLCGVKKAANSYHSSSSPGTKPPSHSTHALDRTLQTHLAESCCRWGEAQGELGSTGDDIEVGDCPCSCKRRSITSGSAPSSTSFWRIFSAGRPCSTASWVSFTAHGAAGFPGEAMSGAVVVLLESLLLSDNNKKNASSLVFRRCEPAMSCSAVKWLMRSGVVPTCGREGADLIEERPRALRTSACR